MKIIAIIALALALSACGSTSLTTQEMQFLQAQAEQQTLKIDCPAGCSVSYKDPRDKAVIPQRTNGWDAAIAVAGSAERLAGAAIVPWAFTEVAKSGYKALKGSGETHTTNIGDYSGAHSGRTDVSVSKSSAVGDYSGDSSGRVGDYSGSQSGNGGILGDYAGQQSGTSGTINSDIPGRVSSPNDGRFDSPDDYSSRDSSSRDNRVIGGAPE